MVGGHGDGGKDCIDGIRVWDGGDAEEDGCLCEVIGVLYHVLLVLVVVCFFVWSRRCNET